MYPNPLYKIHILWILPITHDHVINHRNNFLSPKENTFVNASVQTEVAQEPVTKENIPKINPLTEINVQSCALIAVLLWKVMNIKEIVSPTEQLSEIKKIISSTLNVQLNANDLQLYLDLGDSSTLLECGGNGEVSSGTTHGKPALVQSSPEGSSAPVQSLSDGYSAPVQSLSDGCSAPVQPHFKYKQIHI